mmetsp:Transcript_4581/g.8697  ORF Transcript_4581/g.8697 Transcript_4581/m.8697 type:complete len:91 (+) Transcript_4581:128-400(+)
MARHSLKIDQLLIVVLLPNVCNSHFLPDGVVKQRRRNCYQEIHFLTPVVSPLIRQNELHTQCGYRRENKPPNNPFFFLFFFSWAAFCFCK